MRYEFPCCTYLPSRPRSVRSDRAGAAFFALLGVFCCMGKGKSGSIGLLAVVEMLGSRNERCIYLATGGRGGGEGGTYSYATLYLIVLRYTCIKISIYARGDCSAM